MLPRSLTVCADDFGLSQAVSNGIAHLAHGQRISALSCLSNARHWAQSAPALRDLPASVGVGLHINLTEGRPLCPELARIWPRLPSLPSLMLRAHLGRIPGAAVQCEILAQWKAFVRETGRQPMHVDGHQHVIHLPGVRTPFLAALAQMQVRPAVRNTARLVGPGFAFKRCVIRHSGARQLEAALQQNDLPHNTALLGAYDFRSTDYRSLMQAWLAALPAAGGLLFCHPALGLGGDDRDDGDLIGAARQREFAYLGSDGFLEDLASANVTLVRAWQ